MSDDIQPHLDFNREFEPGSNEPLRARHLLKVVLISATIILIAAVITIAAARVSRYNAKVASSRNSTQSGRILTSPTIISPIPVHATTVAAPIVVPPTHTGKPWSGWPWWAGTAVLGIGGLALVIPRRARRNLRHQR